MIFNKYCEKKNDLYILLEAPEDEDLDAVADYTEESEEVEASEEDDTEAESYDEEESEEKEEDESEEGSDEDDSEAENYDEESTEEDDSTEEDETDTSDDEQADKRGGDEHTRHMSLFTDFLNLFNSIKNTINKITEVKKSDLLVSSILVQTLKNLNTIEKQLFRYIQFIYNKREYVNNLYHYNLFIESYKINVEMMKKIKELNKL